MIPMGEGVCCALSDADGRSGTAAELLFARHLQRTTLAAAHGCAVADAVQRRAAVVRWLSTDAALVDGEDGGTDGARCADAAARHY